MIKFVYIRKFISLLFSERQQLIIVKSLSYIFWTLRIYFLGVKINYPKDFLDNWKKIKNQSSLDRNRSFHVYKLIKYHNLIFKNKKKIIVEVGVDRGASLLTLFKFAENNSTIIGIDVFEGLKKNNISKFDKYYEKGDLNRQNYQYLFDKCKKLSNEKKKVILFKGFFPNLKKNDLKFFKKKKITFLHLDTDLYFSTKDALIFFYEKLEKNGIILCDDYNFINQPGVKKAFKDFKKIPANKIISLDTGQALIIK